MVRANVGSSSWVLMLAGKGSPDSAEQLHFTDVGDDADGLGWRHIGDGQHLVGRDRIEERCDAGVRAFVVRLFFDIENETRTDAAERLCSIAEFTVGFDDDLAARAVCTHAPASSGEGQQATLTGIEGDGGGFGRREERHRVHRQLDAVVGPSGWGSCLLRRGQRMAWRPSPGWNCPPSSSGILEEFGRGCVEIDGDGFIRVVVGQADAVAGLVARMDALDFFVDEAHVEPRHRGIIGSRIDDADHGIASSDQSDAVCPGDAGHASHDAEAGRTGWEEDIDIDRVVAGHGGEQSGADRAGPAETGDVQRDPGEGNRRTGAG